MPTRKSFILFLKPGNAEEYKTRHDNLWPEMAEMLKAHGVSNYSIAHCPETNQLFGYAEIESEELWNQIPSTSICQKWWSFMGDIMETNPDNSPKAVPLNELFYLK